MIQSTVPSPVIIISKEGCEQCERQYNFFKNNNVLVMKVDFSKLDLNFRQILTKILKKSQVEISYPIILFPNNEKIGSYYVIIGFSETMFQLQKN